MGSARHVGGIATTKVAVRPNDSADTAAAFVTTGSVIIDRADYTSALLCVAMGAATGGPATNLLDAKVEEGDASNLSDAADVSGAAITQLTAVNTQAFLELDLSARKRYLRVKWKATLTGGASPKIGVAAVLTLGGKVNSKPTHAEPARVDGDARHACPGPRRASGVERGDPWPSSTSTLPASS